jgi:AcrR family transcriptional regulator
VPRILSTEDIEEFQSRLCDAAEELFAEHGVEAITMRQLAAKLGVSPMTPYRYFKDKEAILAAVRARGFDRHAQALEQAYFETQGDVIERTNAAGAAYVRFAFENPQAYRLMFDVTQPHEEDYPDLVRAAERSRATMTRHVRDLIAAGHIHGDPDLIGHMYWVALHGAIMLQFAGKLSARFDARTILGELFERLNHSLARQPPRP